MKKQENKPKEKKYYTVKVDTTIPATFTYRILAEDENQALEQVEKGAIHPIDFRPQPLKKKLKKATVYKMGNLVIETIKNYQ